MQHQRARPIKPTQYLLVVQHGKMRFANSADDVRARLRSLDENIAIGTRAESEKCVTCHK